jgi:hypothetical protein
MTTPRTPRKSGGDFTGQQGLKLAETKKEELKEAATRMAVVSEIEQQVEDSIIDYTNPIEPVVEVQVREVKQNSPERIIIANQDLDKVVWGRIVENPGDPDKGIPPVMGPMNMRSFKEGQRYKVEAAFAEHLNQKGYLSFIGIP